MTGTQIAETRSFDALSPQEQVQIRDWTSGRVKVFLAHFWRPDDPAAVEAALIRDWVEILKHYRSAEVSAAMRDYLANPDRTDAGRPLRPGPWAIVSRIQIERARADLLRRARQREHEEAVQPLRDVISAERARQIMAEVGLERLPDGTGVRT